MINLDEDFMETLKDPIVDFSFKLILLGDSGVGKTNLLTRFTKNEFDINSKYTIGVEFGIYRYQKDSKNIEAKFWDTAGQERYLALLKSFFRGSQGCVLVFSLTSRNSFDNINKWIRELKDSLGSTDFSKLPIIIVGNKFDLSKDNREVPTKEATEFAKNLGYEYFEVSAKTGENVESSFLKLLDKVVDESKDLQDSILNLSPNCGRIILPKYVTTMMIEDAPKKKKKCC